MPVAAAEARSGCVTAAMVFDASFIVGFVLGTCCGFAANFIVRAVIYTMKSDIDRRSRRWRLVLIAMRGCILMSPVPIGFMAYNTNYVDWSRFVYHLSYDVERYMSWAICGGIMALCHGMVHMYRAHAVATVGSMVESSMVESSSTSEWIDYGSSGQSLALTKGQNTRSRRVINSCNAKGEFYAIMSDGLYTTVPCDAQIYKWNPFTVVVQTSVPYFYSENRIPIPRSSSYWVLHIPLAEMDLQITDDEETPPPRRVPTPVMAIQDIQEENDDVILCVD